MSTLNPRAFAYLDLFSESDAEAGGLRVFVCSSKFRVLEASAKKEKSKPRFSSRLKALVQ